MKATIHPTYHHDVTALMDQDQEHDTDAEGPTEELRIDQRRHAGRDDGKPQAFEFQDQQPDVGQLAEDEPEERENAGRHPVPAATVAAGLCGDIGLDRPVGAVPVVGGSHVGVVRRIQVSH